MAATRCLLPPPLSQAPPTLLKQVGVIVVLPHLTQQLQVDLPGKPGVQPALPDQPARGQQPDQPDQRPRWPARAGETLFEFRQKSFKINESLEVHASPLDLNFFNLFIQL